MLRFTSTGLSCFRPGFQGPLSKQITLVPWHHTSFIESAEFGPPEHWFVGTSCQISEKAMAPHSRTLAWKIPWTEGPGRLQSMGSLRVRHDWATSLSLSCIGEGNGNPLQCSCLENPRDGGVWWAAVYGVAQSWTRLKRFSSSSSSSSSMSDISKTWTLDRGSFVTLAIHILASKMPLDFTIWEFSVVLDILFPMFS